MPKRGDPFGREGDTFGRQGVEPLMEVSFALAATL